MPPWPIFRVVAVLLILLWSGPRHAGAPAPGAGPVVPPAAAGGQPPAPLAAGAGSAPAASAGQSAGPADAPAATPSATRPVQVTGPGGIHVDIFGLAPATAAREIAVTASAGARYAFPAEALAEPAPAPPPEPPGQAAAPETAPAESPSGPAPADPKTASPKPSGPVTSLPLPPDDRRVALTFNGLPASEDLPDLLTLLRQAGVQATFFLSGEEVEANPEAVATLAAAGHELGTRGYRTHPLDGLTAAAAREELLRGIQAFSRAGFGPPRFFRPPGGRFDTALLEAVRQLGLEPVLWSSVGLRPEEGEGLPQLADRVRQACFPGAVLMLRADRPATVQELPTVLGALQAAGCQPVSLSAVWGS